MSEHISRDEDYETYPYLPNGPLAPGLDGVDKYGWSKGETWQMNAESSGSVGDYAVGTMFEARYMKTVDDLTMVVEETYFVEPMNRDNGDGTFTKHYDVTAMYSFTVCTDPDDPGGTELWTDVQYDGDLFPFYNYTYADAETVARRCALADKRYTLGWNGGIPVR